MQIQIYIFCTYLAPKRNICDLPGTVYDTHTTRHTQILHVQNTWNPDGGSHLSSHHSQLRTHNSPNRAFKTQNSELTTHRLHFVEKLLAICTSTGQLFIPGRKLLPGTKCVCVFFFSRAEIDLQGKRRRGKKAVNSSRDETWKARTVAGKVGGVPAM